MRTLAPVDHCRPGARHSDVKHGETLQIWNEKVCIYGIKARAFSQTCTRARQVYGSGRELTFALADLVRDKTVIYICKDTARYGWMVGICTVGYVCSIEINRWMVQQGGVSPYLHYGGRIYGSAASQVKSAGQRLYASTDQSPWDYRENPGSPSTAGTSLTNTVLAVPITTSVIYVSCVAVSVPEKRPSCAASRGRHRSLTGTSGPVSEMMV